MARGVRRRAAAEELTTHLPLAGRERERGEQRAEELGARLDDDGGLTAIDQQPAAVEEHPAALAGLDAVGSRSLPRVPRAGGERRHEDDEAARCAVATRAVAAAS
ncbi:hypothetical protein M3148_02645 [Georgenia satyanarayanai]|uniref:hypothetical protein n=1 Tax=Georgenia satyanarayanai TaxID=860221 RepID=UPI002041982D|nr:hypothetical protein [Georgenia satyanarayanai]MCM3659899.1 hypothetical protein [Georgenia satyanarayanai]